MFLKFTKSLKMTKKCT